MGNDIVYNNTGQAIEIRTTPMYPWSRKVIPLGQGERAIVFRGDQPGGRIVIRAAGCTNAYDPPAPPRAYWPERAGDSDVQLQIERDFSMLLLPYAATGVMPTKRLQPTQTAGFPARPIARTCG